MRHVPVNLIQSGDLGVDMLTSTRVRKSPLIHKSIEAGARAVTVYNHMYHPRSYIAPEEGGLLAEHKALTERVTLWNVAVERQIQIKGPDALAFADYLVTRDLKKKLPVNQARYVILCDQSGGIINDPVILRVAEDEIWLSISDSDVLLWARAANLNEAYAVSINEIDVAPVQVQGPYARPLMRKLFGDEIDELKYYRLMHATVNDADVVISRTGFSGEVGYEIYILDAQEEAGGVWDYLLGQGQEFGITVIAPSHIRRLEAGILSYGQDMDIENNPFQVRLGWQVDFDGGGFIGKDALARIARVKGEHNIYQLEGLVFDEGMPPITWYNQDFWPIRGHKVNDLLLGYVTSAFYSPQLGRNIALAMIDQRFRGMAEMFAHTIYGSHRVDFHHVPFVDPNKEIPKG